MAEYQRRVIDPWHARVKRWLAGMGQAPEERSLTSAISRAVRPDEAEIAAVIGKWQVKVADLAGLVATMRAIAALTSPRPSPQVEREKAKPEVRSRKAETTTDRETAKPEVRSRKAEAAEAYTVPWDTPAGVYEEKKAQGQGARTGPVPPNPDKRTTLQERLALGQHWNTLVEGLGFHLRDPALIAELRRRGTLVCGDVSATMLEDLRDLLVQVFYREGQSPEKLAKDIDRIFPRTYWGRAQAIAQTETLFAGSVVQHEAYQRDGVTHHQWITSFHNSRDSHVHAHGQVQPIGQPFRVGGSQMMHPGDGAAPAREVIRCHCDEFPAFSQDTGIPNTPWLGEPIGERPQSGATSAGARSGRGQRA